LLEKALPIEMFIGYGIGNALRAIAVPVAIPMM